MSQESVKMDCANSPEPFVTGPWPTTNQNTFDDRTGLDGETLGRDAAKALTVIGT